jgi:hypothetical protein
MKRIFLAAFSTCAATLTFIVGVALPLRAVAVTDVTVVAQAPTAFQLPAARV